MDCKASPMSSLEWISPILDPCHYNSCFQYSLSNKFLSTSSVLGIQFRIQSEIWIMYISLYIINTIKRFACSAYILTSALDGEQF
jgi:hypothetical protein